MTASCPLKRMVDAMPVIGERPILGKGAISVAT
ncbi:protein of unknown function [Pararobbsia alpina]